MLSRGAVGAGRIVLALAAALTVSIVGPCGQPAAATSDHRAAPRFQLVYLYPANTLPVPGRVTAIAHEARVVDAWFATQMNGLSPRFAVDLEGRPSVIVLASALSSEGLSDSDDVAAGMIATWRADGAISATTVPIVYVEGRQRHRERACGWYESPIELIVIPIDNCGVVPSARTAFPYRSTAILAHEIVHALGALAAPQQADHSGRHTSDDPSDLMYEGALPHDWQHLTLDADHDDYYLTDQSGDTDIEHSPLLEQGRAQGS